MCSKNCHKAVKLQCGVQRMRCMTLGAAQQSLHEIARLLSIAPHEAITTSMVLHSLDRILLQIRIASKTRICLGRLVCLLFLVLLERG